MVNNTDWRLHYPVHLNDLGNHFPRVKGEKVTHTLYLILFWQGEVDYQNNSSYIFKEEGKHCLGATALSAFHTRCLLFNGPSYLGNENQIRIRPHFPTEQMCISHGTNEHTTMQSHHQFKTEKNNVYMEKKFLKPIKTSFRVNIYFHKVFFHYYFSLLLFDWEFDLPIL